MASKPRRTFRADFRTFFVRGLVVLLPSVLTLWIVVQAFLFVQARVAEPINAGIRSVVIRGAPLVLPEENLPPWFNVSDEQVARLREQRAESALRPLTDPELRFQRRAANLREYWDAHWYLRLIGLVVAIVLIYLAGRLLGGYIGRRIYMRLEKFLTRIPVVKQVYPHVKQIVDFVFGDQEKIKFNRVVLVEYPRKGIWTVGLMTGGSMRDIARHSGNESVTVFIPSSPTPFTGYTITVPKDEAIDLPISIEEALRFVVSGGVLIPEKQATMEDVAEEARARLASERTSAMMESDETEGGGSADPEREPADAKREG